MMFFFKVEGGGKGDLFGIFFFRQGKNFYFFLREDLV